MSRSAQSLRFESIVRRSTAHGAVSRLADLDFAKFGDLAAWMSVIEPDHAAFALNFVRAGASLCEMLGRDLIGLDYLEFVDPAIKGEAFDSAFVMLSRPCGLWQVTPGLTVEGQTIVAEYTGFPVYDHERKRGLLITMAHTTAVPPPKIAQVRHATTYAWLELKGGGALH